jgi:hypothetical protein
MQAVFIVALTTKGLLGGKTSLKRLIEVDQLNDFLQKGWEITHLESFGETQYILVVLDKTE